MSDHDKLNLWQKLKRLLTAAAPQTIIDAVDDHSSSPSVSEKTINDSNSNNANNIDNQTKTSAANKQTTKVSLTKNQTDDVSDNANNNANATPIIDYLKTYFGRKQWRYTHYRPKLSDRQQSHHLSLHIRSKKLDCGYLFRVQEKNALLAVYGILPFLIPESHQSAAMLLITQINYDMLIGNLELDLNDGEIRYKNAVDTEVVGIDDAIIEHLLQSVVAMTTVAYEIFDDLISTQDPSENMQTLLGELRQRADARTFFLPTQKTQ